MQKTDLKSGLSIKNCAWQNGPANQKSDGPDFCALNMKRT